MYDRSWINALECKGISAHGALPCKVPQIPALKADNILFDLI